MPISSERTETTSYWWTDGGFGGVIGKRGFHALSPVVGSKTTPGASEVLFSCLRKTIGYCLGGITPIGAFPVGASFLVGTTKGLILVGLENPEKFMRCLFKKEVLTFLD